MGSVIETEFATRFSRNRTARRVKIGLVVFYLLALPAFIIIGLQPADTSAEVRSSEISQAEEYLEIHSIGLSTPVIKTKISHNILNAPQYLAGAYHAHDNKTLIIGHSATIFENLHDVSLGDLVDYEDGTYRVSDITTKAKADISMSEILKDEPAPTLILMTCAGEPLDGMDFSHRLIITAEKL